MIFAVEHKLGASLIDARTPAGAIKKARRYFGEFAEPITMPKEQEMAVAWAKSMGAGIIALVLLLLSVGVAQADTSQRIYGDSVPDCSMWFDKDSGIQHEGRGCSLYLPKPGCYQKMQEAMRVFLDANSMLNDKVYKGKGAWTGGLWKLEGSPWQLRLGRYYSSRWEAQRDLDLVRDTYAECVK